MQEADYCPAFHAVLHSSDHIRLIANYLCIDELMAASALCRTLHALFDGDAVWQGRLREAEAVQYADDTAAAPAADVLSAAQQAALPPLPSLSEAAALCSQSYYEAEQQRFFANPLPVRYDIPPPPRITAIVHLPSTLRYHAKIVSQRAGYSTLDYSLQSRYRRLQHAVTYMEFTLTYSEQQQKWVVDSMGDADSGVQAINADDNVGRDKQRSDRISSLTPAPASVVSSKQRYIDLLQCSEHVNRQCCRLLPPSPPLHASSGRPRSIVPPVCPLPLCANCRTVIARCIRRAHALHLADEHVPDGYWAVTRINRTEYDVAIVHSRSTCWRSMIRVGHIHTR